MQARDETHERLLLELAELRQRVAELEASEEDRQRAEEALEQERQLLRTVIDNLPDYIYVKDAQSRFVAANAAVARVMGEAAPNLLVGKADQDFYPEHLAAKFRRDEQRVLSTGQPLVNEDEQLVDASGKQSVILTTKVPLRDAQGNIVGLVGIGRDITARKQAEEALRQAHADLEARVAERTGELARANEELTREMADRERTQQVLRDSEALYSSLVENLPVHVLRKDRAGRFVFANRSFCELVGKPLAEIVGKTDFDLYPAELAQKFRDDDLGVMESGRLFETVEENRQDGEPRQMQVMKSSVRDAADRIIGVQVVFWDVTERTRAETALQRERYLLHSLMDNLPHNIYFKDASSRFLRINRAMATAFELTDAADALGKTDADFFTQEHARQAMADEQEILRTGQPVLDKEEKETWPDGHVTWAFTTKMPLRNEAGRIVGTFGISRDITDWKQAAEALRQAKEAAEAANRAKSTFLANMSHEIRTPLNAVIGMTELVLSTPLTPQQKEFLTAVRDSGEALLSVINDILDFSKIEAGRIVLDRAPFDLWESLGDTVKSFAFRAHTQGLELVFHIDPDVPRLVLGDYGRLRQIIVNLIGNAIKFTEQGEVLLTAHRESSAGDEVVLHFTVADTGIGIPPDKQATVFEVFEQVDSSLRRRHGGTGLGLTISSRLVELMGGRIWVESDVGQGSRFHFTVRLSVAGEAAVPGYRFEAPQLHGLPVLVVDDNATNRRILDEVLRAWGMQPTTTGGAKAAWERMQQALREGEPFRLVLTDAHMPDLDGFSLVEQIKADAQLSRTVVVMLTSGDHPEDGQRCQELGIAAYLLKPVKQSELLESIERALGLTVPAKDVPAPKVATAPPARQLRVLVAEDSLVNQKLAVALLERRGHVVTVANNGREALAATERQEFDLVLMDVQMPELDGFEATQAIRMRERQSDRHLPIIAVTAHALKGDDARCLAAGMDGYVSKPISAAELYQAIETVVPQPHED